MRYSDARAFVTGRIQSEHLAFSDGAEPMGLPETDLTFVHTDNRDGFEQKTTKVTKDRGVGR